MHCHCLNLAGTKGRAALARGVAEEVAGFPRGANKHGQIGGVQAGGKAGSLDGRAAEFPAKDFEEADGLETPRGHGGRVGAHDR